MPNRRTLLTIGLTGVIMLTLLIASPAASAGTGACEQKDIHKVEGEIQAPIKVSATQPTYPEAARKERVQGKVVVLSVIDKEGLVESAEVVEVESTDRQDLRQAALDAVEEWTFDPATLEGEPVAVCYHLTINFRLSKDGKS